MQMANNTIIRSVLSGFIHEARISPTFFLFESCVYAIKAKSPTSDEEDTISIQDALIPDRSKSIGIIK